MTIELECRIHDVHPWGRGCERSIHHTSSSLGHLHLAGEKSVYFVEASVMTHILTVWTWDWEEVRDFFLVGQRTRREEPGRGRPPPIRGALRTATGLELTGLGHVWGADDHVCKGHCICGNTY